MHAYFVCSSVSGTSHRRFPPPLKSSASPTAQPPATTMSDSAASNDLLLSSGSTKQCGPMTKPGGAGYHPMAKVAFTHKVGTASWDHAPSSRSFPVSVNISP